MTYVLVDTWEAFTISAGNIIRYSFAKTHLLLLIPPNIITNTQACVASIQIYSKGITQIAEDTFANINLLMTRTNDPMVTIQAKDSIQQQSGNILLRAKAYATVQKRTIFPL